jgi:hypothetical protein
MLSNGMRSEGPVTDILPLIYFGSIQLMLRQKAFMIDIKRHTTHSVDCLQCHLVQFMKLFDRKKAAIDPSKFFERVRSKL